MAIWDRRLPEQQEDAPPERPTPPQPTEQPRGGLLDDAEAGRRTEEEAAAATATAEAEAARERAEAEQQRLREQVAAEERARTERERVAAERRRMREIGRQEHRRNQAEQAADLGNAPEPLPAVDDSFTRPVRRPINWRPVWNIAKVVLMIIIILVILYLIYTLVPWGKIFSAAKKIAPPAPVLPAPGTPSSSTTAPAGALSMEEIQRQALLQRMQMRKDAHDPYRTANIRFYIECDRDKDGRLHLFRLFPGQKTWCENQELVTAKDGKIWATRKVHRAPLELQREFVVERQDGSESYQWYSDSPGGVSYMKKGSSDVEVKFDSFTPTELQTHVLEPTRIEDGLQFFGGPGSGLYEFWYEAPILDTSGKEVGKVEKCVGQCWLAVSKFPKAERLSVLKRVK